MNNKEKIKAVLPSVFAFLLPVMIWGGTFILYGIYPFGTEQIVAIDGWHQYFPFLKEFVVKVKEGSSLFWSWTGGGTDYLAQLAYYLLSPTNLLLFVFPEEMYREVITWLIPLKMGLGGYFMYKYLSRITGTRQIAQAGFSTMYVTCGWIVGYYWNIIWIDTFVLLPLVMTGLTDLLQNNKWKLYTVSLFLSIFSNFLIGMYVCIFLVLMFVLDCVQTKRTWKEHVVKLKQFAGYSLLSGAMTAILTIPAYMAIRMTVKPITSSFPAKMAANDSIGEIVGKLLLLSDTTKLNGTANWFSGLACILLLSVYWLTKSIKVKEKICYSALLLFLLASNEINTLYYMWNGFNSTASMPGRFTFLFTFTLVVMACKAFIAVEPLKTKNRGESVILAAGMALMMIFLTEVSLFSKQPWVILITSLIFLGIYLVIFVIKQLNNSRKLQTALSILVVLLFVTEASLTLNTVSSWKEASSSRTGYPLFEEEVKTLLDRRETLISRTEITGWENYGRNALYSTNGWSLFSSTTDYRLTSFLKSLGFRSDSMNSTYIYQDSSPLNDMFFNVEHTINLTETTSLPYKQIVEEIEVDDEGTVRKLQLLRNEKYLPLGFVTSLGIKNYSIYSTDAFAAQNSLFRLATGIEEELFEIAEDKNIVETSCDAYEITPTLYHVILGTYSTNGSVQYEIKLPKSGEYYLYCAINEAVLGETVRVLKDETEILHDVSANGSYIRPLGGGNKGDIITVSVDLPREVSTLTIAIARINENILDEGYSILSKETLDVTEFAETKITGTLTTDGGMLYTSIPYTKNWKVRVNGKEAEIEPVGNCMIAFSVEAGTHNIEIRYINADFLIGCIISAVAFVSFFLLIRNSRKNKKGEIKVKECQ